jgi:all-trans-retinol 13,14-reductase
MSIHRIVVIGTGAGGLTASAFLAKEGFEVIALERSIHVGGLLNPYSREGFVFNPGVHYLGQCGSGQAMDRLLEALGLSTAELMAEMDPDGFDVYRFPDFEVRMCRGAEAYRDRLAAQFPGDVKGADKVFEAVSELSSLHRVLEHLQPSNKLRLSDLWDGLKSAPLFRYVKATYGDFLDHAVSDPRLKAVFAAACGDYGLPPSRASALVGLSILNHYMDGAYYPRGGSGSLRDAVQHVATQGGATFRTGAEVKRIEVEGERVRGVRLVGGEPIEADAVVAAIDPRHVFGMLMSPEVVPTKLLQRVRGLESSVSALALNLGVNRDLQEIGLGAFNIWDYPDTDIDAVYDPIFHGRLPEKPGLFISPNSLKDPTGQMAPKGKTSLEVLAGAPFAIFGAWADVPPEERRDDFHLLKQRLGEQLLAELDARLPGVVEHVELADFSTPLSMQSWVNAIDGGLYGPAMTPDQSMFFRFSTSTFLPNLFLAGAGVFGDGVLPCMQSGQVAANMVKRALSKRQ